PNLAALGQLHEVGPWWFFTMELIDGVDFLQHVRARPARLPDVLRQLLEALCYLHATGKVHRDIKPSNVLVAADGRVVLLDFGLVTEAEAALQSTGGDIVGTPAYMAPEQAAGHRIDSAADCYALGVILYEALAGRLPFDGSAIEILLHKQERRPEPPGGPAELADLCMELLEPEPGRRLTAAAAVERLCGARPPARTTSIGPPLFLGRTGELAALQQAIGGAGVCHVEGESGVGKSALLAQLAAQLRGERAELRVLAGRCYERELTHHRAFEGVIDGLVRALAELPDAEVAALVPPDLALLARMFPALEELAALDPADRGQRRAGDVEARARAGVALRELLRRLAHRFRLVAVIDDVQWADRDSLRLLAELLRPPAPPIPWVLASRPMTGLAEALGVPVQAIRVDPLDAGLAEELAGRLLSAAGVTAADAAAIARETAGHPLHIAELVRHASEAGAGAGRGLRLDQAIVDRLARLPPAAQDVAELLAIAGAPVRPATLRRAADLPPAELQRALVVLRQAHLIRRGGAADDERVEPYHDRVREALAARVDARRAGLHERLAAALSAAGEPPELLVRHLEEAGQTARAARCAVDAAGRASASMASGQAAELYKAALRLGTWTADERRDLRIRLGDELAASACGREAAQTFLAAAEGADPETDLDCRRRAAEQLLISGWIDEGMQVLTGLLGQVGLALPATPRRALASVVWNRALLGVRGRRWRPRREAEVARADLARLDVYQAVSHGLSLVDNIRGADFNARWLRLALATGEPVRLTRALGTEALFLGSQGGRRMARARRLVGELSALADRAGSDYARAWAAGVDGLLDFFDGRFLRSAARVRAAEDLFRAQPLTGNYERSNLRIFQCHALSMALAVGELAPVQRAWLAEAEQRGDRYTETVLRRRCGILWLAAGDVDGALAELDHAHWTPPSDSFHLQHWYEVSARAEAALVAGTAAAELEATDRGLAALHDSLLDRVQIVRVPALWLQARVHLAAAADPHARAAAGRRARATAAAFLREGIAYATLFARLLQASERLRAGDPEAAAVHLHQAIAAAADDTAPYAAAARHRLAALLGGTAGADLAQQAATAFEQQGVSCPWAIADLLVPGYG
ncbi:MAG TPA: AAA family ATPase, partial [Kofleriaceae bacterium]|nr:AAA family ATPase [Kofleriaceae bacterium]